MARAISSVKAGHREGMSMRSSHTSKPRCFKSSYNRRTNLWLGLNGSLPLLHASDIVAFMYRRFDMVRPTAASSLITIWAAQLAGTTLRAICLLVFARPTRVARRSNRAWVSLTGKPWNCRGANVVAATLYHALREACGCAEVALP